MFFSLAFAIAPWAAAKVFNSMPVGFNGVAGVCSACWAACGLLVVLDSVASPLAFMGKYHWLPWPYPHGVFDTRTRDVLCGMFSSPPP